MAALLPRSSVLLAAALAALGVALGGRSGIALAAGGVALTLTWARAAEIPAGGFPDSARPVRVIGQVQSRWTADRFGWVARLRADLVRQGARVEPWRSDLWLWSEQRPPPTDFFRATGYLRRPSGFGNPGARATGRWSLRIKSGRFLEAGAVSAAARGSRALRQVVERAVRGTRGDTPGRQLMRALLLGDAAALPGRVRRALRRAGLSHLMAVSGLHVGLVTVIGMAVGIWLPRRVRWLPGIAAALAYLLLVGPRPALVRASSMAVLAVCALRAGRPPAAVHALAVAAAGLVALDPGAVTDLSFRLTTAATAGILLSGRWLADRWTRLPGVVARPLAASVGAQLCTLPWALPAFHLLTPLAPLLNLVAIPWTAAALAVIVVWTLARLVAPAVAAPLGPLLEVAAWPFFAIADLPADRLPAVPISVGYGKSILLALVVGLALSRPRLPILLAAVLATGWTLRPSAPEGPTMVLLDVGQGESMLLRDGRRAVLVDGGGWRQGDLGGAVLLPALAELGIRRLDAVVLTHPDLDHCRGLTDLGSYLPIAEVWTAPGWGSECARELIGLAGTRWRPLWEGRVGSVGAWRLRTLHPPPGDRSKGNDRSLVIVAEVKSVRFLLTGDVESAGERRLLARHEEALRCEVLKVAHHGSSTSSSPAFLAAAAPRLALISAGRGNPYGHPAAAVLERFRRRAIPVLGTDRSGQVRLRVTGEGRLRLTLPAVPR